jgi:GntR family transcriptional repressor for pyruvate dehydrogenase complex
MARLHVERMRELLGSIAAGDVAPGAQLPREVDLTEQLGVSRAVVRAAIQGLVERGVVSVKHGRGQTVRPPEDWDVLDVDVLTAVIESGDARELLREVLEARTLLEVPAAALAAERASTADVEALRESVQEMARTARARPRRRDEDPYGEAEEEFQRRLALATGNRPLARTLAPLQHATRLAGIDRTRRADSAAEHERLLEAISRADAAGARAAAEQHLRSLADALARRSSRRSR